MRINLYIAHMHAVGDASLRSEHCVRHAHVPPVQVHGNPFDKFCVYTPSVWKLVNFVIHSIYSGYCTELINIT